MIDYIADTKVNYRTERIKVTSSEIVYEELKEYSIAKCQMQR